MEVANDAAEVANDVEMVANDVEMVANDVEMVANDVEMVPYDAAVAANNNAMVPYNAAAAANSTAEAARDAAAAANNNAMVPYVAAAAPINVAEVVNDAHAGVISLSSASVVQAVNLAILHTGGLEHMHAIIAIANATTEAMMNPFGKVGGKKGRRCSMLDCLAFQHTHKHLSFFRFPRDKLRCAEWIAQCGRPELHKVVAIYEERVCQLHFETKYFLNKTSNRLRTSAVPVFQMVLGNPNPSQIGKNARRTSNDSSQSEPAPRPRAIKAPAKAKAAKGGKGAAAVAVSSDDDAAVAVSVSSDDGAAPVAVIPSNDGAEAVAVASNGGVVAVKAPKRRRVTKSPVIADGAESAAAAAAGPSDGAAAAVAVAGSSNGVAAAVAGTSNGVVCGANGRAANGAANKRAANGTANKRKPAQKKPAANGKAANGRRTAAIDNSYEAFIRNAGHVAFAADADDADDSDDEQSEAVDLTMKMRSTSPAPSNSSDASATDEADLLASITENDYNLSLQDDLRYIVDKHGKYMEASLMVTNCNEPIRKVAEYLGIRAGTLRRYCARLCRMTGSFDVYCLPDSGIHAQTFAVVALQAHCNGAVRAQLDLNDATVAAIVGPPIKPETLILDFLVNEYVVQMTAAAAAAKVKVATEVVALQQATLMRHSTFQAELAEAARAAGTRAQANITSQTQQLAQTLMAQLEAAHAAQMVAVAKAAALPVAQAAAEPAAAPAAAPAALAASDSGTRKPRQIFTNEMEALLTDWALENHKHYGSTCAKEVRYIAYFCARALKYDVPSSWHDAQEASTDWYLGFVKRNRRLNGYVLPGHGLDRAQQLQNEQWAEMERRQQQPAAERAAEVAAAQAAAAAAQAEAAQAAAAVQAAAILAARFAQAEAESQARAQAAAIAALQSMMRNATANYQQSAAGQPDHA